MRHPIREIPGEPLVKSIKAEENLPGDLIPKS
jgi:hypothetical protein